MSMKLLFVFAIVGLAVGADEAEAIRAVLRRFNQAVHKPESQPLRAFFTLDADYRDATRVLKGRDALGLLFANRQVWTERTPPMIQKESIRLAAPTVAFVDAQLVQYGSTIVKSGTPVVLLLEKEAGGWKIASWRMACPMVFAPPQ
jgi:ketosteroid isomerase-like protein